MKNTIFIHLLLLVSCISTKQPNSISQTENSNLSARFSISARTRQFLSNLNKELIHDQCGIKEFKLSEKLLNDFAIRKQGDTYLISGFIKTNEDFDKPFLEKTGITFGQQAGQICTVNIPLQCLSVFLDHEGIEYFEISEKIQIK
jgi:hypothetical protein